MEIKRYIGKVIHVTGTAMIVIAVILLGIELFLIFKGNSALIPLSPRVYDGTAVHDMDLNLIESRYGLNVTYLWNRNVSELPFPVRYYTYEDGDYKLAFTTEDNVKYVISVYGFGPSSTYGVISWPTYDKGWRYTTPFIPAEKHPYNAHLEPQEMYYVQLHDLRQVFNFMVESGQWSNPVKSDVNTVLLGIDLLLYDKNVYVSPDLNTENGSFLAAVLLFAGCLICFIKIRLEKH